MMYTRQLKEFLNELKLAKGRNCLIFAIADNSEEFVEQVSSSGLHVDEIHLNGNINLLEVLLDWDQTDEKTVYFVEGVRRQFPWVLGYLNLHRDIFYEIKRPVVIFGSEYEITEITRYAPDLWRFRSRTYDFTEKKGVRGDFLPISSEQLVAAEDYVHYDLPIFGEESEDEIRGQIRADNYLLEIIKEDYKRAELYMSLAISYLKLQDFGRGKEYFGKASKVRRELNDNRGMSVDYKRFGDFYAFKGEYDEAAKYYREAIRAYPGDAKDHSNLGVLLKNLKRYDEAEEEYREAIRADPDYAAAHYNLGVLLSDLKRYGEAVKYYREAIRADPDLTDSHGNLGIIFLETERLKNAKKEFKIAKELFENQGRESDVIKVKELLANLKDKFTELKTSDAGTLTAHATSA
ncbi:MAG: tetratricopeptide repeat protein [Candidatus Methanospirareceae archaeon]